MDQFTGRSRAALALRGVLAVLAVTVIGTVMVMRGSGSLHRDPEVSVAIPATAGLISGEAPVRYSGVNVGRISGIDSGTTSSTVRLQIDADSISLIPATVLARVVPRTFFGDIYIQLVDDPTATGSSSLSDGAEIGVDTGPEAVALYGVYTKVIAVLDHMQPQKMQAALTELGKALDGRGETVGRIVDRLDSASRILTPPAQQFLDVAPELRSVMRDLDAATPDVIATLSAATSVSQDLVDHRDGVAATFGSAAGFASVATAFAGEQRERITTVLNSAGTILATTAANPAGLVDTLAKAKSFGAAGARVFSTGKFDITTVATFSDPLPYDASDCPRYGAETSAGCVGSAAAPATPGESGVVDGAREAPALKVLQDRVLGATARPDAAPNPATVVMLGPLVRGNEVTVR
ncbi:MCE family protein [Rhodococcus kronopolitis]|uniref:MCE family protein n=1 Tax=Rhodococcus kronopolitis TaxID=1460226 RepID=A0ABV9FU11_9NOCA